MTIAAPTDRLVSAATEAETRQVMAERAALADVWQHRQQRRELLKDVDRLLGLYAVVAWGPAKWRV